MDWTKQANDMIKTWTGTQQKVWESWVTSMQTMSTTQSADAWQKTVETWRGTVREALNSQVELTRLWTESVAEGTNTMTNSTGMKSMSMVNTNDWTRQMLELTRTWTETQARFSENWFDMLQKADPTSMAQSWNPAQAQQIMQTWQEAAQKATEAQNEWSRMMTSMTNNITEHNV